MPLIMSIFFRKKVSCYWHAFFKNILLFKSVSGSVKVTQVRPTALKTVASHPIAVKSHLDVMNIGVRTPLPLTWKENKVPLRNTTHGCTVSSTRYNNNPVLSCFEFLSGMYKQSYSPQGQMETSVSVFITDFFLIMSCIHCKLLTLFFYNLFIERTHPHRPDFAVRIIWHILLVNVR